jgi:hypothetical protein
MRLNNGFVKPTIGFMVWHSHTNTILDVSAALNGVSRMITMSTSMARGGQGRGLQAQDGNVQPRQAEVRALAWNLPRSYRGSFALYFFVSSRSTSITREDGGRISMRDGKMPSSKGPWGSTVPFPHRLQSQTPPHCDGSFQALGLRLYVCT